MLFSQMLPARLLGVLSRAGARFRDDTAAATAVEYGLMLAGIAVFILVAVFSIGDELNNLFNVVQTKIANGYS